MTSVAVISILCVPILLSIFNRWMKRNNRPPLPPGPKGLPLVGAIFALPRDYVWHHVAKHKDIYGPISSITILGETFVFLNDRTAAVETLGGARSAIYIDRQSFTFPKMCGMGDFMVVLSSGKAHKAQRKLAKPLLGSNNAMNRLEPDVEIESQRMLARILSNSGEQLGHDVRTFAAALILKITYGYSMDTKQSDPLVHDAEEFMRMFTLAVQPGAWLVDLIPVLRFLPSWMPGSGFKHMAIAWRKHVLKFVERPYLFVKQQMTAGTASPSYLSELLEHHSIDMIDQDEESIIKWSAGSVYMAGSDTSVAQIHSFFLAMVLFPEVQKKAQAEIDDIIGPNRLPTAADRGNLPYVDAVAKEALRWHTNLPLSVPHVATEDDVYEGYLIPKGSTVFACAWLYNHDPSNYHDPFTFKPERFLSTDSFEPELDPSDTVFGFGRRVCLGKRLAESSVFNVVAMSLATLNIQKACDTNGVEITPVHEVTSGLVSQPKPFPCCITARSAKARDLIISVDQEYDVRNDAEAFRAISMTLKNKI